MLEGQRICTLVARSAEMVAKNGVLANGYLMLQEPQVLCLVPHKNEFDISIDDAVWEKGTQRQQAAIIALSTLGCNLPNAKRMSPVGVRAITKPDLDYKMWKQNFRRCYDDLKTVKSGKSPNVNSCVFTMVHPVLNHKPCIVYAQFRVIEGRLSVVVNARTTHIFMLHENLLRYIHLQLLFSSLFQIPLGTLFFITNSLHVYDNQRRELSCYARLDTGSQKALSPSALNLKDYHRDRRLVRSGRHDKITWDTFRKLVSESGR